MPTVAAAARAIPRLPGLDHTAAFLADPYRFIARACAGRQSDVVQARLLLQPTLCLVGPDAARLFYDPERFTRVGAAPEPLRATLFGKGAVQTLDGPEHLARKAFFLQATTPARVAALAAGVERSWRDALATLPHERVFSLYPMLHGVLTQAVCAWAGVPLAPGELAPRSLQLAAMFDQPAAGMMAHLRVRQARAAVERWLCALVLRSRRGEDVFAPGSVAYEAAHLRGAAGALLPPRIAAVELVNVLRPVVATSVYVVLAAHALHRHRQWRAAIARGEPGPTRAFVQEVRRFYPFFPAIAARTRHAFEWNGLRFPARMRAMLDLYGTNQDPRSWNHPSEFQPERFLARSPGLFDFIPQGGGRVEDHHRCPGEGVVLAIVELMLRLLATGDYVVPPQDLRIRLYRMPALPVSGFLLQVS